MQSLTKWALGSVWQGIFLAGCCYVIPFCDFMAMAIQGLVTLRQGMLKGFVLTMGSVCLGAVLRLPIYSLFFNLIGSQDLTDTLYTSFPEAIKLALMWSLPFWLFAGLLRKTVSLTFTLQVMTFAFMGWFLFSFFNDIKFFAVFYANIDGKWIIDLVDTIQQRLDFDLSFLTTPGNIEWLNNYWIHLLESKIVFSVFILLLLMTRVWQSLVFMPGEFRKEFINLRTGRLITVFISVIFLIAFFASMNLANIWLSLLLIAMLSISTTWLFVIGLSYVHWFANTYNASWGTLVLFYVLLLLPFSSGILMTGLMMLGLIDGIYDFRSSLLKNRDI